MASAFAGNASGSLLPASAGACTLLQHPVHAEEMLRMHEELGALVVRRQVEAEGATALPSQGAAPSLAQSTHFCDWPEELVQDSARWMEYMKKTHANGRTNCWTG